MILYKASSNPFENHALQQCLVRMQNNDKLILTQDAVYALSQHKTHPTLSQYAPVYLLEDDVLARGLSVDSTLFKLISYADFVELTLDFEQVISW